MSDSNYPTLPEPFRRVIAGAEFLDGTQPDWVDLIDLRILDIARGDVCVLGQIGQYLNPEASGRTLAYLVAADRYGLDAEQLLVLGFSGPLAEIPALTAAWKLIVEARHAMAQIGADLILDAVLAVA